MKGALEVSTKTNQRGLIFQLEAPQLLHCYALNRVVYQRLWWRYSLLVVLCLEALRRKCVLRCIEVETVRMMVYKRIVFV